MSQNNSTEQKTKVQRQAEFLKSIPEDKRLAVLKELARRKRERDQSKKVPR